SLSALCPYVIISCLSLFFCHDPPTTEIYTLSLHDALPILNVYILVRVSECISDIEKNVISRRWVSHLKSKTKRTISDPHTLIEIYIFFIKAIPSACRQHCNSQKNNCGEKQ